jgi:PilZ domain
MRLDDRVVTGQGRTVNISSTGILFEAPDLPPAVSALVELSIAWPARLDNKVPLTLYVGGHTVWTRENRFAVAIQRYEFRTTTTS